MFQNRVPDRIKQIIWNDTANNPYSKESVARRLLVYFDYMPFMSDGREIVEKLQGILSNNRLSYLKRIKKQLTM